MYISKKAVGMLLGLGLVLLMTPASAFAVGDPLANLTNLITTSGRNWAAAILIIGALLCGGAISLGSARSGEHARNFIVGAIFLALVALGKGLYDLVTGWVSPG